MNAIGVGDTFSPIKNEIIIRIVATNLASLIFILPEAIGRFFLNGCSRSFSMSIKSFMKYTDEEAVQKAKKAVRVLWKAMGLSSCPVKKIGAKTIRFLIHCRGRASLSRW